jgi:hypothetical protein
MDLAYKIVAIIGVVIGVIALITSIIYNPNKKSNIFENGMPDETATQVGQAITSTDIFGKTAWSNVIIPSENNNIIVNKIKCNRMFAEESLGLANEVGGNMSIMADGLDVIISKQGSNGNLKIQNEGETLIIQNDGSGSMDLKNILGDISLSARSIIQEGFIDIQTIPSFDSTARNRLIGIRGSSTLKSLNNGDYEEIANGSLKFISSTVTTFSPTENGGRLDLMSMNGTNDIVIKIADANGSIKMVSNGTGITSLVSSSTDISISNIDAVISAAGSQLTVSENVVTLKPVASGGTLSITSQDETEYIELSSRGVNGSIKIASNGTGITSLVSGSTDISLSNIDAVISSAGSQLTVSENAVTLKPLASGGTLLITSQDETENVELTSRDVNGSIKIASKNGTGITSLASGSTNISISNTDAVISAAGSQFTVSENTMTLKPLASGGTLLITSQDDTEHVELTSRGINGSINMTSNGTTSLASGLTNISLSNIDAVISAAGSNLTVSENAVTFKPLASGGSLSITGATDIINIASNGTNGSLNFSSSGTGTIGFTGNVILDIGWLAQPFNNGSLTYQFPAGAAAGKSCLYQSYLTYSTKVNSAITYIVANGTSSGEIVAVIYKGIGGSAVLHAVSSVNVVNNALINDQLVFEFTSPVILMKDWYWFGFVSTTPLVGILTLVGASAGNSSISQYSTSGQVPNTSGEFIGITAATICPCVVFV